VIYYGNIYVRTYYGQCIMDTFTGTTSGRTQQSVLVITMWWLMFTLNIPHSQILHHYPGNFWDGFNCYIASSPRWSFVPQQYSLSILWICSGSHMPELVGNSNQSYVCMYTCIYIFTQFTLISFNTKNL